MIPVEIPTKLRREENRLEVHEHTFVSGSRAGGRSATITHSHEGGNDPHRHPDTGPACYTIDKDDWARLTGVGVGGTRKKFTIRPEGEQFPLVEMSEDEKSFEIHYGSPPPDFKGTGGGHLAAARMILRFKLRVAKIIPFPGPKRASA